MTLFEEETIIKSQWTDASWEEIEFYLIEIRKVGSKWNTNLTIIESY